MAVLALRDRTDYTPHMFYYLVFCGVVAVAEVEKEPTKTEDDQITYLACNGKTFMIIEHFSGDQTYADIVKNALRREAESI